MASHSHIAAAGVMLSRSELVERVGEGLAMLDVKPDTQGVISASLTETFEAMLPLGFAWRGAAGEIEVPLDVSGHPPKAGFILSPGYDLPHPRRDGDSAGDDADGRSVGFDAGDLATAAVSAATFRAWRRLRFRRQ